MKSEITLSGPEIKAEGKIIIEYTNGETGEVENRFESENHAFPGGFMRLNNHVFSYNSGSSSPFCIFLSDRGDDVNYDIPIIPGNIIGIGSPSSNTDGVRQGAEDMSARSLGVYSSGKWHYKRRWSWLPNQITKEIKSFGIAPYEPGSSGSGEYWNICTRQLEHSVKGDPSVMGSLCVYNTGKVYNFSGTPNLESFSNGFNGTVKIYDLNESIDQTVSNKSLKTVVPIPSDARTSSAYFDYYSAAYYADIDSGDIFLVMLYKTNTDTASVQVTRFDADMSIVKTNTVYPCGTRDSSDGYPFCGYNASASGASGYFADGCFYALYNSKDTSLAVIAKIDPSKWSESGDFRDAFSYSEVYTDQSNWAPNANGWSTSIKNGNVVFTSRYAIDLRNNQQSNRTIAIIMDTNTNKAYASRYVYTGSNSSAYWGQSFIEKIAGTNVFMQLYASTNTNGSYDQNAGWNINGHNRYYRNLSDYTLYVLPDNAPKREEGQGVTITYEIAWGYEEDN